jgi:hypothetical protein
LMNAFSNYFNQKNGGGISKISDKGQYSLSLHPLRYRYFRAN